jgi:hypothetical protein
VLYAGGDFDLAFSTFGTVRTSDSKAVPLRALLFIRSTFCFKVSAIFYLALLP